MTEDLLEPTSPNSGTGGTLGTEVYFVAQSDLTTQPAIDPTTGNVIVDLAFGASAKASKIYSTMETLEVKSEPMDGENADVLAYENSASFFHPNVDSNRLAFIRSIANVKGYFFVKECSTGTIFMIGDACHPAIGKISSKFGKTVTEGKGLTFTFSAKQPNPYCIYEGEGIGDVVTP